VSRHAPLPGAAELFRSTVATPAHAAPDVPRTGSGRQKHDSKITVYVSGDELVALEQARLALRAQYGLAVDRGRVVREAVAVVLADLDENGEDSVLVRRLARGT
jgi:hypothetical protein